MRRGFKNALYRKFMALMLETAKYVPVYYIARDD
jgi:hypothetical protein